VSGISYDAVFFPSDKDGSMAHAVPNPDTVLGFRLGDKPATHAQIEAVVKSIAANSPRTKLVPYAVTHEGRTLYYLVISSEENIRNLDKILEDRALFADPRKADAATGDRLAATLPAVAWMAYSIHGDEMSGADASLAYAYHLAATSDADTVKMLSEVIVVIDPLMNPDGRDRCLAAVRENRTSQPNLDDQSVIHSGVWPSGRMNHYLFDLNRDWIFATQPESRGRILAASRFEPQLFMESHEMGSQDTFLFSPPREAINANIPGNVRKWWEVFAKDQAASFDTRGWRYYTGEWNDEWYPGYTGSWGNHRNAIGILYEQAAIVSDGVRRPEGTIETYREAVHHQLVSSVANVTTLWRNRAQVMKDFLAERRAAVGAEGPYASRTFAILPGANEERTRRFLDLMHVEGFEVHQAGSAFRAAGKDRLGRAVADREFPAGTLLVANRQPLAHQVAVMLEFDPRPSKEFLTDERRELLRFGRSKMYDVTGWSIPMLLDLDAYELSVALPSGAKLVETPDAGASAPIATGAGNGKPSPVEAAAALAAAPVGYAINGADDRAVAIAGRLMERGVRVRASDKPTMLADVPFPRGSLFVLRKDNGLYEGDLGATLTAVVSEVAPDAAPAPVPGLAAAPRSGLAPVPITTGMGPGDLPDLGGEHFALLSLPRIAVLGREPFSAYSYGEIWHLIDHTLGLRATYLDASSLGGVDLRRYNVIIAPSGGGSALKESLASLKAWCEGGGTLIAIGSSAATIATESSGMSAVRLLPDVLTKLDDQRQQVVREWEARRVEVDPDAAFAFAPPKEVVYPWQLGDEGDKPSDDEAKRRDGWRSLFMPQGAVLATRVDDRSWLTSGCADELPVMYDTDVVLVCGSAAEAPLRVGVYSPLPPGTNEDAKPAPARSEKDATGDAGAARPETPTDSGQPKGKTERVTDGADRNAKKAGAPRNDADVKDPPKKEEPKTPGKDDDTSRKGDKDDANDDKDDKDKKDKKPAPGWMLAPPGYELRVRMSGLLWPEAADRIAHSAWLTREQVGRGQVILFASSPTFRAATLGTSRVLSNAIVYGPGMGASEPIRP
jgi:hypothetical protein